MSNDFHEGEFTMDIADRCKFCEKITITVETTKAIKNPLELPNTFDVSKKQYVWKFHDFMAYALVPHTVEGTASRINTVDMYACIDEDDLDDIDVYGYTKRFFHERILPEWKNIKNVHLSEPVLDRPEDIECRKLKTFSGNVQP
jgi:hypothetical protein